MIDGIFEILKTEFDIAEEDVLLVCPYGSEVYGTRSEKSDRDYVVVANIHNYLQYESDDIDIHLMSVKHYKYLLNKHEIMALETYFNKYPLMGDLQVDFELILPALRRSISSTVSNSWVKAKKKVTLENEDDWVGYKSLFHSLRILAFGIQIAETGRINNFQSASHLWSEILQMVEQGKTIKDIMKHFKPILNSNQRNK